jgi:hypothetical protein
MIVDSGRVYNQPYITVAFPTSSNPWIELHQWCTEMFGTEGSEMWGISPAPKPASRWYINNSKFWFRDEADASMFLLRWT